MKDNATTIITDKTVAVAKAAATCVLVTISIPMAAGALVCCGIHKASEVVGKGFIAVGEKAIDLARNL